MSSPILFSSHFFKESVILYSVYVFQNCGFPVHLGTPQHKCPVFRYSYQLRRQTRNQDPFGNTAEPEDVNRKWIAYSGSEGEMLHSLRKLFHQSSSFNASILLQ